MEILGAVLLAELGDARAAAKLASALAVRFGLAREDSDALASAAHAVCVEVLARSQHGDLMFSLREGERTELIVTARDNWPILDDLANQEADTVPATSAPHTELERLVDEVRRETSAAGTTVRLVKMLPIERDPIEVLAKRGQEIVLNMLAGDSEATLKRQHAQLAAALKERLQIEGERRADEERLQLAIEVAEIGVCEIGPKSAAPKLNPQALALLGIESATSVAELVARVRADHRQIATALFHGEKVARFFELAIEGSPLRWLGVHVRGVTTDRGEHRLVALKDITPQKHAQHAAEDRVALEEQFLGIVSHDLKNPLATTLMGAEALLDTSIDERYKKTVALIQRASRHAIDLVEDLLDFTRARLGRGIPVERFPADMVNVCRDVIQQTLVANPEREIRLEATTPVRASIDPTRMRQVIANLIANALTYGSADEVITVTVRTHGDRAELAVKNGGKPISTSRMEAIFEPLHRGGRKASANRKNLGLGLFIVREIVRAHDGEISCASSEADGTTFTVRIPAVAT